MGPESPPWWERVEHLGIAVAAVAFFSTRGDSWLLFLLWAAFPDVISLLLSRPSQGPRQRHWSHILAHTYTSPLVAATLVWMAFHQPADVMLGWVTHIGLDRAFARPALAGLFVSRR